MFEPDTLRRPKKRVGIPAGQQEGGFIQFVKSVAKVLVRWRGWVQMKLGRSLLQLCFLLAAGLTLACAAGDRELIRDADFQSGFYLLEPKPGTRVVYGELKGAVPAERVWDLAQWSSRFPLEATNWFSAKDTLVISNSAKSVVVGKPGQAAADLSLAVNAGAEYLETRKSSRDPWVHLLVQQHFVTPPTLGELTACNFHLEARLKRSRLVSTNDYSPAIHAAQFLVYLSVASRNPRASGSQECFWFGIPIYDNRERIVPAYEAQDFGETRLFIFTPGSDTFANESTHDGTWVAFEKDLLPLLRRGLEQARAKGFIKGSPDPADYRPLGIFIGWEVPGRFDVELQIRNLSLKAVAKERL